MICFNPIGSLKTSAKYPYDLPHQPCASYGEGLSVITLNEHENFEQALLDLETFTHVWILFYFHKNAHYKPKVLPPRGTRKRGLFATRSPHRPNAIGLSVCRLVKIQGRQLYLDNCDMLDETPILDIKPYLAYVDAIPEASLGWIEKVAETFDVCFSPEFELQFAQLLTLDGPAHLVSFLHEQLSCEPLRDTRKRVKKIDQSHYLIAYRTWRITFVCDLEKKSCTCLLLDSGYTQDELKLNTQDPYNDKMLHRQYLAIKSTQ